MKEGLDHNQMKQLMGVFIYPSKYNGIPKRYNRQGRSNRSNIQRIT